MNASKRELIAATLAMALLSPAAWSQQGGKGPPEVPRVAPPAAPVPASPEQTLRDIHKPMTTTTDQADTALPPPAPPTAQGSEHAMEHSSVVQRDLWAQLDTDGDGRISSTEGAVDTDFNNRFATLDADHDGFVTDAEYRDGTRAEMDARQGADAPARDAPGLGTTLRRLDTDADGAISASESEADAAFKADFARIDADSDGMVTRAEYQAWLKANRK